MEKVDKIKEEKYLISLIQPLLHSVQHVDQYGASLNYRKLVAAVL